MLDMINGENLPGYKKKSFAIPMNSRNLECSCQLNFGSVL